MEFIDNLVRMYELYIKTPIKKAYGEVLQSLKDYQLRKDYPRLRIEVVECDRDIFADSPERSNLLKGIPPEKIAKIEKKIEKNYRRIQ